LFSAWMEMVEKIGLELALNEWKEKRWEKG
jgi:hypothetical protein